MCESADLDSQPCDTDGCGRTRESYYGVAPEIRAARLAELERRMAAQNGGA